MHALILQLTALITFAKPNRQQLTGSGGNTSRFREPIEFINQQETTRVPISGVCQIDSGSCNRSVGSVEKSRAPKGRIGQTGSKAQQSPDMKLVTVG
jgi:hypothetical protein